MTKIATSLSTGNAVESATALAKDIKEQLGQDPVLAVAFASTSQPLDQFMGELKKQFPSTLLLGASTAGEFTEKGDTKNSACIFALHGDYKVHAGMGNNLKASAEASVQEAVKDLPATEEGYDHRTAILLLDPLSGNGEEATLLAAGFLGENIRLAGGAAGDDLKMEKTHVALGDQVASDALVVATIFSKNPLGVGVRHGHQPISDPVKVTKAEGGTVFEIEGRPAWDVWQEKTREVAQSRGIDPTQLKEEELGGFLLRYEAGLSTGGDNYKIRAPLTRNAEDGSINFACGIPQGTTIRITESVAERQVESAREAARRARQQIGDKAIAGALVFDCICRNLILGDQFESAVKEIHQELGEVPLAGFETYGEIALDVGDMSGFHNTTTVVLAFPQD